MSIAKRIDEKYEGLKKNIHFNLCYLYLAINDYTNAIKHANILKRNFNLNPQADFILRQYLAEAYCMSG